MTSNLTVYWIAFKNALAERMAYRADFVLSVLIMLLFELIVPMITLLIYRSGSSFPGWTMYEALLIQALFLLVKGLAFPFFFGLLWNMFDRVREGTFDLLLIKPRMVLFMAIVTGIDLESFGKLFGGIGLLLAILPHIPAPSTGQWVQLAILLLLGMSVICSFALMLSGTLFQWVGNGRVWEIFDCVTMFGLYPRSIFSKSLQLFLTAVMPIAMIGFFPAAMLLDKPHKGMFISAGICLLFLIISLKFWYLMLRRYTSAGG
jgi:ABC-2 type transport system permease protein